MTPRCDHVARAGLARREAGTADPHVAGCLDCQDELRALDRVATALPAVELGRGPQPGWEARVLAAIDSGAAEASPAVDDLAGRRAARRWWLAVPAIAVAAAAIWLVVRPPAPPPPPGPALAIVVERGATVVRGTSAAVGDTLRIRAAGAGALWIYRDDTVLALACPRGATCGTDGAAVTAALPVTAIGIYTVVSLWSTAPLPAPTGRLDDDLPAAHAAGARSLLETVDVR